MVSVVIARFTEPTSAAAQETSNCQTRRSRRRCCKSADRTESVSVLSACSSTTSLCVSPSNSCKIWIFPARRPFSIANRSPSTFPSSLAPESAHSRSRLAFPELPATKTPIAPAWWLGKLVPLPNCTWLTRRCVIQRSDNVWTSLSIEHRAQLVCYQQTIDRKTD